jgi:hypothetical protein
MRMTRALAFILGIVARLERAWTRVDEVEDKERDD